MDKRVIRLLTLAVAIALPGLSYAQLNPIDFEPGGYGADWTWTVFENETNPPVEIIDNPSASGINTSATVMQFTALVEGNPWAGCESQHGSDIGTFSIDATNCTVKVMVYKPVISNVGVKFARPDGGADPELLVANTVVNQWEELTFDFSGRIGLPNSTDVDQIIFFPDFDLEGRTQDNVCYLDNITFSEQIIPEGPENPAPVPTEWAGSVISLFSNVYDDEPVDTWSAPWDVADVQDVQIDGDDVKLYTNLEYAGIEFTTNTLDITEMTHFHIDIWTPDPTELPNIFWVKLVDFGANGVWDGGGDDVEDTVNIDANYDPPLETSTWVCLDIPMSEFELLTTREHLAQLLIGGDPNTVYVDNVYWYDEALAGVGDTPAVPTAYLLEQNYPNPFNPTTTINYSLAVPGQVSLAVYDLGGRLVKTLVDGDRAANRYQVNWNGTDYNETPVASGVYFYQLTVDNQTIDTKRMMLMK